MNRWSAADRKGTTGFWFAVRCVHLSLLYLLFFASYHRAFGESDNEGAYKRAVLRGQAQLEKSYVIGAAADRKAGDAKAAAKAARPEQNDALETSAKLLNDEAKRLAEEAKAFAEKALKEFTYAETIMSEHSEAIFGEGLSLLQLKEYCSAIRKIEWVRKAKGPDPETTFALGNALVNSSSVGSPELKTGIDLLGDYIRRAEASGNPQAYPNLAIAKRLKEEAEAKPKQLVLEAKRSDDEPNLALCPMPIPGKTELPFTASISSAIGYNNNVIALGRSLPLPNGVAQKSSFYNESTFALARDISMSHPASSSSGWLTDRLSLRYIFIADTFQELPTRDRLLQTISGSYQRAITPKLAGLVKISDQLLYIDQSIFSNVFSAQEALVLTLNTRWKTLLSYYLVRIDGFDPSTPATDPDGFTHRAELAQTVALIQDKDDLSPLLAFTGQYGHEWNETKGITGRFERDDLLGKLEWKGFHARNRCSFVQGITLALSDQWQPDRYTNATFSSSTSNGLFARAEETNAVVFAVSLTMWYDDSIKSASLPEGNRLETNFSYRHTTRDSNVNSKTYDQDIFLASVKFNF